MTDHERLPTTSSEELQVRTAEELPDGDAASFVNAAPVAAPSNADVALDAPSDDSVAIADAAQQSRGGPAPDQGR